MRQICFPLDDGCIVCNSVYRKGKLIVAKGKWFKFMPKGKKRVKP